MPCHAAGPVPLHDPEALTHDVLGWPHDFVSMGMTLQQRTSDAHVGPSAEPSA